MCQIMEEIYVKGEERGEARGEARGLALGIKQGEERGSKKEQKKIIIKLLKKMSFNEVADTLDMTAEEVEKIISSDD